MTQKEFEKKWSDWWKVRCGVIGLEMAVTLNHFEFMNVVKKISEEVKQIEETQS